MIFLPRNDYASQEKCKTLIENELLNKNYYIYRWRQVPVNTSVLGVKAENNTCDAIDIETSLLFVSGKSQITATRSKQYSKGC